MNDFSDPPWEAADRFTPELMELVGDPLYSAVCDSAPAIAASRRWPRSPSSTGPTSCPLICG